MKSKGINQKKKKRVESTKIIQKALPPKIYSKKTKDMKYNKFKE